MAKPKRTIVISSHKHIKPNRSEPKSEVTNSRNFQAQTSLPHYQKSSLSKQIAANLKQSSSIQQNTKHAGRFKSHIPHASASNYLQNKKSQQQLSPQ